MPSRIRQVRLDKSAGPIRRALQYAAYDWTREMPGSKRIFTYVAIVLQGYAVYVLAMWAFILPTWLNSLLVVLPKRPVSYLLVVLLYYTGYYIQKGMLTSEFLRKTQLEADQIASRQIQQTLIAQKWPEIPGYQVETFYKPFREVGGDYFDIIELPNNQTLFALADVSGKGMPAALLAANIQALVRSIVNLEGNPVVLARQINTHLFRYTPSDRFATALFIRLSHDSGELTYVNAGHNAPLVFGSGPAIALQASGMPLGLFPEAAYEVRTGLLSPGGTLLLFTDGLTDSISGDEAENSLRDALADSSTRTISVLKSLIDPRFNEDDVTILLVKRDPHAASMPG
jgi:sigma-B regulation protein RsbU (phosphoserine phosphatase)